MDTSKLPKSWYFNDKKYKLVWKKPRNTKEAIKDGMDILGDCAAPSAPANERSIRVNPNLEIKEFFEILLHEASHSSLWVISEEEITEFAENITALMFECFNITEKQ